MNPVLESEKFYFNQMYHRIQEMRRESEKTQNTDFAAILNLIQLAYDEGKKSLFDLDTEINQAERAIMENKLPANIESVSVQLHPSRVRPVVKALISLRCLDKRPSEVFRELLRKNGSIIMQSLQNMAVNQQDAALDKKIEVFGSLFCELDILKPEDMAPEPVKESWFSTLTRSAVPFMAGVGAKVAWDKFRDKKGST